MSGHSSLKPHVFGQQQSVLISCFRQSYILLVKPHHGHARSWSCTHINFPNRFGQTTRTHGNLLHSVGQTTYPPQYLTFSFGQTTHTHGNLLCSVGQTTCTHLNILHSFGETTCTHHNLIVALVKPPLPTSISYILLAIAHVPSSISYILLVNLIFPYQRLKEPQVAVDTVFPHMRTAMWATGLTTSKTSDGIQKLLQKSGIDRLKNATLFPNMQKAEDMLKDCWSMTKAASAMSAEDHRVATKAFGLVCIRLTLHLLSKEKHARESRKFDTMEEIVSQFGQDLKKSPAPAPSSSTSTTVANLLVAKPKDIALLQHSHIELNELHLDISVFLLELIFLVQHFSNTISTRCFSFDNLFWCLLSISGMPTRKSMARKFSN